MDDDFLNADKNIKCDLCNNAGAVYDGKTTLGPWAYMCQNCFDTWGVGLGLGKGQKVER